MPQHKNNDRFLERLAACVERLGGKRAMAVATGISESQVFRYLNGDTELPRDRVAAIAKAAKVDPGWLLTGDGMMEPHANDPRPTFRAELMVQVVQTFEELLIETNTTFTPRQRALAMTLIYEALRFEEVRTGTEVSVDKRMTPYYPDFLAPLRSDNRMEDYLATMKALEYGQDVSAQSLKQFDALVKMGLKSAYEGAMGEIYFDKMGQRCCPKLRKPFWDNWTKLSRLPAKISLFGWMQAAEMVVISRF